MGREGRHIYEESFNFISLYCIQEKEELPEDCIPDLPENSDAREFLAHAPSKGLWMPLGKEVKVMKCMSLKMKKQYALIYLCY